MSQIVGTVSSAGMSSTTVTDRARPEGLTADSCVTSTANLNPPSGLPVQTCHGKGATVSSLKKYLLNADCVGIGVVMVRIKICDMYYEEKIQVL